MDDSCKEIIKKIAILKKLWPFLRADFFAFPHCTEGIFDSPCFMFNKRFLKKTLIEVCSSDLHGFFLAILRLNWSIIQDLRDLANNVE